MTMRARILRPGFFANEELARLPVRARLLFAGLWCLADREGRLENRPERIRAAIFPYERVQVTSLLQTLEKAGFIKSYQSASTCCIALPRFAKYQQPHHREPESNLPPEPGLSAAQPQPSPTDPVTRSGTSKDQDQEQPAASRPVLFRRVVAIASRVLDETDDLGLDPATITEEVKRELAKAQIPYNATLVGKALEAAEHGRAKRHA